MVQEKKKFECSECGFVSYKPGKHCGKPMKEVETAAEEEDSEEGPEGEDDDFGGDEDSEDE